MLVFWKFGGWSREKQIPFGDDKDRGGNCLMSVQVQKQVPFGDDKDKGG